MNNNVCDKQTFDGLFRNVFIAGSSEAVICASIHLCSCYENRTEPANPNNFNGNWKVFTNHISVNEDKGVIFPVPGFPLVKLNMNTCNLCPLLKSKPVELVKNLALRFWSCFFRAWISQHYFKKWKKAKTMWIMDHVPPHYASTTTLSLSGQLDLTMLGIGVCLIVKVQSLSQFTCNGENWITEGIMSSPSMLGGDMHKFKHIDWWNS